MSATESPDEIDEYARAFVVRTQGRWRDADVERLLERLKRRTGEADPERVAAALAWFHRQPAQLFVCAGRACRKRGHYIDALEANPTAAASEPLSLALTKCQGPCKQGPVATLRAATACTMFAQLFDECALHAVLEYGARAAAAGTLLVDRGHAQRFMFDPVHDHGGTSRALQCLDFLIGHFRGDGLYPGRSGSFHKEVVGTWEAGGRFIGLRMSATYPLADGRHDVHHALVMVGYNSSAGAYEARPSRTVVRPPITSWRSRATVWSLAIARLLTSRRQRRARF